MAKQLNKRGETLVETLCAVLVLALAVALLGAMISASFRLDQKTDKTTAQLYEAFSKAEAQGTVLGEWSLDVEVGGEKKVVTVNCYGDNNQVVSYRMKAEGGMPGA